MARNNQMQGGSNVIMGGDGASSFVDGAELKQVDTPTETVLGAVNGTVSGGVLGVGGSAAMTYLENRNSENVGKMIIKNIKETHLAIILTAAAAMGLLGAYVRNSRARKHNQWADRQFELLQQQSQSHADRVDAAADAAKGNAR